MQNIVTLGEINDALKIAAVTAAQLADMGFAALANKPICEGLPPEESRRLRNAKLYPAESIGQIRVALAQRLAAPATMQASVSNATCQAAPAAVTEPDGWRLVPVDPTEQMEQAAADYLGECVKAWGLWKAMIASAPENAALAATPAAACGSESVLIDGVAYDVPAAVAGELLSLHLDLIAAAPTYIEVRECSDCGHIGINDADGSKAACSKCDWQGDSPVEDKCPDCNTVGTMTAACSNCGARASLLAETTLHAEPIAPAAAAPVVLPEPVGWRHSLTLTLHETEEEVQLADGDSHAQPLFTEQQVRALLAGISAPAAVAVADERWCPDVCPITGRRFFGWIEHWKTRQQVPTYGGPFDSYTIPVKDKDGTFSCERFDHDAGEWMTEGMGWCDLGLQLVDDQAFVVQPDNPRYDEIRDFAEGRAALATPAQSVVLPEHAAVVTFEWRKKPDVKWLIDTVVRGTKLYTEQQVRVLLARVSAPAAQAVASIYVTADGQRECDDWKMPLPIGRNLLYTAPQMPADAQDALTDSALLDAMEQKRIAVVPEYEGPWDAEIYNDDGTPNHRGSGSTPREAIRAAIAAAQQTQGGGDATD